LATPQAFEASRLLVQNDLASHRTRINASINVSGNVSSIATACTPEKTIYDFGFYDGHDASFYLAAGFCVVGVEAAPDLYQEARVKFQKEISEGRLQLLNMAVVPSGQPSVTFYRSKCSRQWNSFLWTVACRTCVPPLTPDPTYCEAIDVSSAECKDILGALPTPHYLKLDIEGAETGCFHGLYELGAHKLPQYISAEITELAYVDYLANLGYKGYKLVLQNSFVNTSSMSGPWGEQAADCRTAAAWRTYEEIRLEVYHMLNKVYTYGDPCPGGTCSVHQTNGCGDANVWYDIHASLSPPV
jgi:FkbM family methyltransferase